MAFILSVLGLLSVVKSATPPSGFWPGLATFANSLPGFFDVVWRAGLWVMSGWATFLLAAALVMKRLDIFRDQVLALAGSAVAIEVVGAAAGGTPRSLWGSVVATGPPPAAVSARVALVVAATVAVSPWLARPFRAWGWWLLGAGACSEAVLGVATPSGVVLGLLCGASAAFTVRLVLGSSGGRPGLAEVRRGLLQLGVPVGLLSEAVAQEAGVFSLDATDADGSPLRVKVYGRDAWDAQLLAKAWRALWYRGTATLALTRLQQVEHEGFMTLLAARNGVPTQDIVRAGRTADNDAIIVMRVRGVPLTGQPGGVDAGTVGEVWDTVVALGTAGLVHGDLHPLAFREDRGQVLINSLASASVATDQDHRHIDVAQLLIVSALFLGPEPALDLAFGRLGPADLAAVVPYLQKAALGPQLRVAAAKEHFDVDGFRAEAAARAEIESPKMATIRRVSTRALVQAGLLAAAAYFLISTLAGVDINQVLDALRSASLPVLLLALVVGQLPRFAYAESTRAACPRPIPYGPPVLLQFSVTFISLVFPGTVARMALNVRFFQRQGIPPASAVSIGLIENFGGYVVQVFIIVAALVFGFGEIDAGLQASGHRDGNLLLVLALLVAAVIVAAVVAVVVPQLRRWVMERIRPSLVDLRDTLATLRSPSKVMRLLLANLAAEVLFASTLGLVLVALGSSLPLATLLVVNVFVSFFASMIPIPGGIGVSEGALMVGLTAVGIDQSTAFAAAICYRLCTFYLPPIWGWFAFRRLEHTGLL
ncbi:MAG TPA: lysylphosphatidylglycerol synthase transmembrane domain-containing protein [Acidimicrobiales bacterium]|nr:lysylphosphatidylglycerol synthase transmembrane domain-containing protein [Acidimicrobiales bacterium]